MSKKFQLNKLTCAMLGLLTSVGISSQALAADTQENNKAKATENVEHIQVVGIRSSIINALDVKRSNIKIVDGISADDLGKLPTDNIAEGIQRITGVQISRADGRGQRISIRGLDPRLARVTINGQTYASAGFDGFDFGFIESEIASSIDVYKTPTADLDEGGLAGTINIESASPLDFNERKFIAKISGTYQELEEEVNPRYSFAYADKFLDDKLGILFTAVNEEVSTRFDKIWIQSPSFVDTNGNGEDDAVRPTKTRTRIERVVGDSTTLNFAADYQVSEQLKLGLKGVSSVQDSQNYITNIRPAFGTGDNLAYSNVELASISGAASSIFGLSEDNVDIWNLPVLEQKDYSTYAVTADFIWANDNWTVSGVAHTTEGKRESDNKFYIYNSKIDHLDANIEWGALAFNPSQSINDASTWSAEDRPDAVNWVAKGTSNPSGDTNQESSFQLDFDYTFDSGALHSIEFGTKYRTQRNDRFHYKVQHTGATELMPDFKDIAITAADNFLGGNRPSDWPAEFLTVDLDKLIAMTVTPEVEATREIINNDWSTFSADRDIFSVYAMANFEGEFGDYPYRANVGARYVSTEQNTSAPSGVDNGSSELKSDYDNILPSFTLSVDLTDDWVTRFSASKVLVRPALKAPNFNRVVNSTDNQNGTTDYAITQGNPNLKPQIATAFDAALEYYYGEGNAVYVSVFYKDVDAGLTKKSVCPTNYDLANGDLSSSSGQCLDSAGNVFAIDQVTNSDDASIYKGIELGLSHNFENGFGFIANTTYLDSNAGDVDELTGQMLPPLNMSKHTHNLIGYYEDESFSVRAAYNYRSSFLANLGSWAGNSQRTDRGQLDVSASYHLTDNLELSVRALNLTGEPDENFAGVEERFQEVGYAGKSFEFGIRYEM